MFLRMTSKTNKIKKFWDEQAIKYKTGFEASWKDILTFKEIEAIKKEVCCCCLLLDIGCANGFSTFPLLEKANMILGIDYSKEMIKQANKKKKIGKLDKIDFEVGNILDLDKPRFQNAFDQVVCKRVIINLNNKAEQKKALRQMHSVLIKHGVLLLSEPTIEGLNKINKLRKELGLELMKEPWHNKYISEAWLKKEIKGLFKLEKVVDFSSTYYVMSRVFNAFLNKLYGSEPGHNDMINKMALSLPDSKGFGIQKLFVLRKI